jgi:hypothetical protein
MPLPPRASRRGRIAAGLVLTLLLAAGVVVTPATPAAAEDVTPKPLYGAVFDGQSNTLVPGPGNCYPTFFMLRYMPGIPFANVAVGGTSYAERTATAPTRVDPLANSVGTAFLFTEGGASDIVNEDLTPQQVIDNTRTYIQGRRAAGYDAVVSSTILPGTLYGPADEATRLAVNQLLRERYRELGIDVLVDIASHPLLQNPQNPAIYSDGIHLTQGGAEAVAWIYAVVLMQNAGRA